MPPVTAWDGAPHPPRRWQAEALPVALDALRSRTRGLVYACTGSGKSVLLAEIAREVVSTMRPGYSVVVSVPTQALVQQLAKTFRARLGRDAVGVYYGRSKAKTPRPVMVVCLPSMDGYTEWANAHGQRCAVWIGDEAHRAEAYAERVNRLAPVTRIGVTATPYLADDGLELWDRVVYSYRLTDAIRDEVLVPLRVIVGEGDGGDVIERSIDVCRRAGPYTIVDALDIEDADAHAAELTDAGVPAASIHSGLRKAERERRMKAHAAGDLHALTQVDMLSEGVDLPYLRSLVLRRRIGSAVRRVQLVGRILRTASAVRRVQLVGRILRTATGKDRATVYDLLGQLSGGGDLDMDARLGRMEADADREARTMTRAERRELDLEAALPIAVARRELDDWTIGLTSALRDAGVLPPLPPDGGEGGDPSMWRDRPVPPGMLAEIGRRQKATRWLDDTLRASVRPLMLHPERLTIGQATDLLDVLRAASRGAGEEYARLGSWRDVRFRLAAPDGLTVDEKVIARVAGRDMG